MILEGSDQAREVITPENQGIRVRTDDKSPSPSKREETNRSEWESKDEIPLSQLRRWLRE